MALTQLIINAYYDHQDMDKILEEQMANLSPVEEEHRYILKKIRDDHVYLTKLEENAVNALKTF